MTTHREPCDSTGLGDARRDAAIETISARLHITTDRITGLTHGIALSADTAAVHEAVDALAPLIAGWLAEERERIAKAIEWEAGGREAQAHSARDEEVEWFGAKRRLTAETKALRDAAKIARGDA